jgi:hypothetical protein
MTYEIVKNMPIPELVQDSIRIPKYPFYKMELGDCVIFETEDKAQVARSSACNYANKIGKTVKFVKRQLDDGRYGIWRVK